MIGAPFGASDMNPVVTLLLTIGVPIVAGLFVLLWHRAAELADELRAFDVEGMHFER